ncbi:MAG: MFS transporter [Actinomycetota bacterium]
MDAPPTHRDDEEPLIRVAARRAVKRIKKDATTPEFGRLLQVQAAGAAGDALLALALAGTLFFSVPETTARGKVALYLALTVAPFAIVSPLLARVLDRHRGSLRWAMVVSAVGRGILAWILVTRLDTLYLFPLAFGLLLLSRASLIVRGAALPALTPPTKSLVDANASLSRISAISGMVVGIPGIALIKWPGVETELLVGAIVYGLGVVPAFRLPTVKGRIDQAARAGAQARARSIPVNQALFAICGMRLLVGFLVFHLAFALRRDDFSSVGLGLLVGSAALGSLVGALVAPRLRRSLREEGILVLCLALAGATSFAVGVWFSPLMAGVLVFVFGVASGASKVAFDAIVQRETPEGGRGWAFARFESILQLAWVGGALVPLLIAVSSGAGALAVGIAANLVGIVFMIGRHRHRSRTP